MAESEHGRTNTDPAINRAFELNPGNQKIKWIYTNLPLAYLLNGQYEIARNEYERLKNEEYLMNGLSKKYGQQFLIDIEELETKGVLDQCSDEIRAQVEEIKILLKG